MERITVQMIRGFLSVLLSALLGLSAQAEVILRSPASATQVGDSQYPPSRFGEAPASPFAEEVAPAATFGVGRTLAATATESPKVSATSGSKTVVEESEVYEGKGQTGQSNPTSLVPSLKNGVQEIALIAGDLGYFPRTVFVTRDIPVRLYVTGASSSTLCIMIDSFNIRKQVRANRIEEILFTPTMPGQYRYYCPVNGMEGTLVVKELKG